jgi:REP element-mobilizing transposase RayT
MSLFKSKYRIESARMPSWDYGSNASYFITICVHEMRHLFGEVIDDEMWLSLLGVAADDCWKAIPEHFPFVTLGVHMVMPNHVHGIITIDKKIETAMGRRKILRLNSKTIINQ